MSNAGLGFELVMSTVFLRKIYIYIDMYIQGRVINLGLKWFFFSMYRPSCLTEAYGSPEKHWLVCGGLLANHLFNLN